MSALTFLGLAAACCTTLAFVPQVVKAWKTRSTTDISLGMFLTMCLGIVLWLLYGGLRGDIPLIIANVITLILAGLILLLKLRHG
jgi:MtN3 and saliva related transmembrane protein